MRFDLPDRSRAFRARRRSLGTYAVTRMELALRAISPGPNNNSRVDLHFVPAVPHSGVRESAVTETPDLLPFVSGLRQDVRLVNLEGIGGGRSIALSLDPQERGEIGVLGRFAIAGRLGSGSP